MTRSAMGWGSICLMAFGWVGAGSLRAQELADFDYENLSFRGFALEFGHLWANRVEEANTVGLRVDMGYLGPGLRITPTVSYWSSQLNRSEVAELEASVERLIDQQGGPATDVDLGTVDWSDFSVGLDAQLVWSVPFNLLMFAGVGAAVHFLNDGGPAIEGNFVEDLLDSANPGVNLHGGFEYPWEWFRLYAEGRFELLEDLNYFEVRLGGQIMTGPAAPGERDR